ncbi:hypothetical protein MKW94_021201 [Papaver nudicaule]|uniref:Uncharacterized protein n=1 Tax=Papaver nudicaule TaxID=74823 RepID=A0AA41UY61_PAPNU|nr:hypothetical protein [Papaver nudicaule]
MAMMHRISSRFSRCLISQMSTQLHFDSSSSLGRHSFNNFPLQSYVQTADSQEKANKIIPGNNMKWGSLGPCRDYSKFASVITPLQQKPLSSILDIERAKNFSPEDFSNFFPESFICLMFQYHLGRGHIGVTVKEKLYHMMKQRRHFVVPLWKGSGYVTMFVQETKDMVVLFRGDVFFTSKLTDEEAQRLLETTQAFYLNDARYKLIEQFNKQSL